MRKNCTFLNFIEIHQKPLKSGLLSKSWLELGYSAIILELRPKLTRFFRKKCSFLNFTEIHQKPLKSGLFSKYLLEFGFSAIIQELRPKLSRFCEKKLKFTKNLWYQVYFRNPCLNSVFLQLFWNWDLNWRDFAKKLHIFKFHWNSPKTSEIRFIFEILAWIGLLCNNSGIAT